MAAQGDTRRMFGLAPAIGGRGVEIVYTVFEGIVYQPVHHLLVDFFIPFACASAANGREAHHPETQQRDAVARGGIGPVGHFACAGQIGGVRPAVFVRTGSKTSGGNSRRAYGLEEIAAGKGLFMLMIHIGYCF